MDVTLYASTSGRGGWTTEKREVKITRLDLEGKARFDVDTGTFYMTIRARFDGKTWKNREDGLIYNDPKWLREFRLGLMDLGLRQSIAARIGYSPASSQGLHFVRLGFVGSEKHIEELQAFFDKKFHVVKD